MKLYADTVVGAKLQVLRLLFPSVMEDALWRASFAPVAAGAAWLVAIGLMWLSFGHMVFAGRDVR